MGLNVYTVEQLLSLPAPTWLIEGILPEQGLTAIYGEPGAGKSFVALDLALSAATGISWHGRAVRRSYVVYISAEGGAGIGKRVGAWLQHHGIPREDYRHILANFVVSAMQIHPDSSDLAEVLDLTIAHPDYQELLAGGLDPDEAAPPLLVVADTLARTFVGDENQQEDMGAFVRALDALREDHGATVLVVHHTNAEGSRERGNTAFRGACDTMMTVSKTDNDITVECSKQKDAAEFEPIELVLVPVEKWESCVVEAATAREARIVNEREADIQAYFAERPNAPIREAAQALGIKKSTLYDWLQRMRAQT